MEITREQLEYYRPLNLNLTLANSEEDILKVTDVVYSGLTLEPHNKTKTRNNLKILILNLISNHHEDKFMFTGVHLNEKKYIANRYNKNQVGKRITKLVHALDKAGYIDMYKGFRTPQFSRITRVLPLDKLLRLVREQGINPDLIFHRPDTETIICQKSIKVRGLKNKVKEPLNYEDTEEIRSFRKLMVDYNNLLNETHIDVINQGREGIRFGDSSHPVKINQNKKFMRRIFNSKDFTEGGRIYGGFWQQLNSEWRSKIIINGQPTREVDYSGLGIATLYDKYEILKFTGDAYDLSSIGYKYDKYSFKELRPLLKFALMIMINSSNSGEALHAIKDKVKKDEELPQDVNLEELIEAFTKRHEPISQFFYKGMGGIQYRMDSEICAKVISFFLYEIKRKSKMLKLFEIYKQKALELGHKEFKGFTVPDGKGGREEITEEAIKENEPWDYGGVPVLTIHDSFVVSSELEDVLRWQMEAQYKLELGLKWNKEIPTKKEGQGESKNILNEEENKRVDAFFNNHNKKWFSSYYKLDEEPKEFIYRNKWHYIEIKKNT